MVSRIVFFVVFLMGNNLLFSQNYPNQELRATWLTTVSNLDWPNAYDKGNVKAQKSSFIKLIESLQEININTVFLQVRTECDAFYNSDYEPWSRYLTGIQGKYPGYDPLQFAIEECHKRGIELHVWLNPYRINTSVNDAGSYYADSHVYRQHPDWAIVYDSGKKILNPGLPQVQNFIKKVAGDILNKYDIDGIHFDDYFYAYGGTPDYLDNSTYETYGSQYATIGDFRRGSINKMIENVMDTILAVKPYVRFGVSPFGIYGNGMNPSGIVGLDAYNVIYCDPLAWLREGTVDYINPQLYWPTGGNQDFATLLPWWANWSKQYNRNVYAGHAIYRLDSDAAHSFMDFGRYIHEYKDYFNYSGQEMMSLGGWSLEEIVRQINIVRENNSKGALGSVYFRAKDFDRVKNLKSYMYNHAYMYKTLLPVQYWKNSTKPDVVTNIRFDNEGGESFAKIVWDDGDTLSRYAIYKIEEGDDTSDYTKSKNLLDVSFNNYYIPDQDMIYENVSLGIVKINRFWKTGDESILFKVPKPETPKLVAPYNNFDLLAKDGEFKWNTSDNAGSYEIEFSLEKEFNNVINKFKTRDTSLSAEILSLEGETGYFWRVRAVNIGANSDYSEVWKVTTGFPATPNFVYPGQNETNVPLKPEFVFGISPQMDSLHLQVSRGGTKFDELKMIIDTVFAANNKFVFGKNMDKYTVHYARVKAKNDYGLSNWSDEIKFKTLMPVPSKTEFVQPQNNAVFKEDVDKIEFIWNNAVDASYYVIQISDNADFTTVLKDEKVYTGNKYSYYYPVKKKWLYTRVAGKNIGGIAPWSQSLRFTIDNSVSTNDIDKKLPVIKVYPNPCLDTFYIDLNEFFDEGNILIKIYNSAGKKIIDRYVAKIPKSGILSFETKQLECHPCFINVITKDISQTLKVFKIK